MSNDWRQGYSEYESARPGGARYDARGAFGADDARWDRPREGARHAAPEGYARYSARGDANGQRRSSMRHAEGTAQTPRTARAQSSVYTAPSYESAYARPSARQNDGYQAAYEQADGHAYREPSYRDALGRQGGYDYGYGYGYSSMYTPYEPQYDPYQQEQLARPSYSAPAYSDAVRPQREPVAYGAYASRAPQEESAAPPSFEQSARTRRARQDVFDENDAPRQAAHANAPEDARTDARAVRTVRRAEGFAAAHAKEPSPDDRNAPQTPQPPRAARAGEKAADDSRAKLERMRRAGEEALRAQGYQQQDANDFMNTGMMHLDAALGELNEEGVDPVLSAQQTARMAVIRQAQMDAPLEQPTHVKGVHSRPGYEADQHAEGKKKKSAWRGVIEWVAILAAAVGVAFLLRTYVISFYRVQGPSMQPTLYTGERLFVNKIGYRFAEVERFDIVVCHYPGAQEYYVKRVVALPGDTVSVENGVVYINGEALEEEYVVNRDQANMAETVVPEDCYMVFGDNRANSMDSRSIGAIERDAIVGRAVAVTWPLDRLQVLKRAEDAAASSDADTNTGSAAQEEKKDEERDEKQDEPDGLNDKSGQNKNADAATQEADDASQETDGASQGAQTVDPPQQ